MYGDYSLLAKQHRLSCEVWPSVNDSLKSAQILLVAAESFASSDTRTYLMSLSDHSRLGRLVIEEAHLLRTLPSSFNSLIRMLKLLPSPIVLATATCPQLMERQLFDILDRKAYEVVRCKTDDLKVVHKAVSIASQRLYGIEEPVALQIHFLMKGIKAAERALLFCQTEEERDRMANLLQWRTFQSSMLIEQRKRVLTMWKSGEIAGLVCDTTMDCCLDYPRIKYIFHLGAPRNGVDYCQSISHLYQSNEPGGAIVYYDPATLSPPSSTDGLEALVIYDMLRDSTMCRRIRPSIFRDGFSISCVMLPRAELCDVCETQLPLSPPRSGPHRFPANLVERFGDSTTFLLMREESEPSCRTFSRGLDTRVHPNPSPAGAGVRNYFATKPNRDQSGATVFKTCQSLKSSCVLCWFLGAGGVSHRFGDCSNSKSLLERSVWKPWVAQLRLPRSCCCFCGCPTTVSISPCHSERKLC